MSKAMMQIPCQVRSETGSPCSRHAEVEILGVDFCGACARVQEAYFAIGELTQEETEGIQGKALAEALKRIRRNPASGREGIAASIRHGLSGVDATDPLALSRR